MLREIFLCQWFFSIREDTDVYFPLKFNTAYAMIANHRASSRSGSVVYVMNHFNDETDNYSNHAYLSWIYIHTSANNPSISYNGSCLLLGI